MLSRQPVFGPGREPVAYRLVFPEQTEAASGSSEGPSPSQHAAYTLINDIGFDVVAGAVDVLLACDSPALLAHTCELLPPERTILDISVEDLRDTKTLGAVRDAQGKGYRLALRTGITLNNKVLESLAPHIIQADTGLLIDAPDRFDFAKAGGATRLLATGVDSHAIAEAARQAGAELLCGSFYSQPETLTARKLSGSENNCLRLLAEVGKPQLDLDAIETILKTDIDLPCGLLRYLNSPAMGMRTRITSIRHAMNLLGEEKMRRWCAIAAVGPMGVRASKELLACSLIRARFCEDLGIASGDPERALDYFMLGLLSTLDAILGLPVAQAIEGLPLHKDARDALTGNAGSAFYDALDLVRACESGAWATASARCMDFGLTHGEITLAYFSAVRWVAEHS